MGSLECWLSPSPCFIWVMTIGRTQKLLYAYIPATGDDNSLQLSSPCQSSRCWARRRPGPMLLPLASVFVPLTQDFYYSLLVKLQTSQLISAVAYLTWEWQFSWSQFMNVKFPSRFLGIILRVLRLEVSVYNVYNYKPFWNQLCSMEDGGE
jgi:hypothetical protein